VTGIRVGFEVPGGAEVRISPRHLGVTGLTQESGKTTLLEALMERANETALAFRTSRGELGFHGAKRIAPYFRERSDWRFVEGLISAHLMEKARFYRGDLMRLTRGTHGLNEVHANIKTALGRARPGSFQEKIYTELSEYLTEIRDALGSVRFDTVPNLTPMALSVMDLEDLSPAVQQLVIAATVDWLMEGHLTVPVIVVLPEARDFIPEDRRTPAKLALESLIRKGARVDRYLWLDSQALTGLDMDVCRSIGTWFFGRQTLDLEIRRVGKMVPGRKLRPDDVRGLGLGQFLMVQGEEVRRVYVQPVWLDDVHAQRVAQGTDAAGEMARLFKPKHKERNMDEKERKEYEERIAKLEGWGREQAKVIARLEGQLKREHDRAEAAETRVKTLKGVPGYGAVTGVSDLDPATLALAVASIPAPDPAGQGPHIGLSGECERVDLHVARETPNLTVHVREVRVDADGETSDGRLARLIADGFFDAPANSNRMRSEFRARGWGSWIGGAGHTNAIRLMRKFTEWGFLREDDGTFQVVPEARERIRAVKEAA
jgi:uncharacterized coiled-coil protein SlyX